MSPFLAEVEAGWEAFDQLVPADVAGQGHDLLLDPAPLASALRSRGTTLVHADLHYGNIAPAADRFHVIDSGLATEAPPAVDVAWYLDQSARFIDASREEVLAAFAAAEGPRHDPATLELALVAELVLAGRGYVEALRADDPDRREARRSDLDWWVSRARRGLALLR